MNQNDFPQLSKMIHGKRLCYLDNAATTLKPQRVINKILEYYQEYSANVHRGIHFLSEKATFEMETTRDLIKDFINANKREDVIFTSGTTMGINTIAYSLAGQFKPDDEIILTYLEHHANIVPWQLIQKKIGFKIKVVKLLDDGSLDLEHFKSLLNPKVKLISCNLISNTLGIINPVKEMIQLSKPFDCYFMVDAAQAVAHQKVDVQDLDCDFLVFSGHKLFGPTGVGILYGKESHLEKISPFLGGGEMIETVSFEETTFNQLPFKFEAGTPAISSIIGLGEAIKFINEFGLKNISQIEDTLSKQLRPRLLEIKGLKIIGDVKNKTSIFSFIIDGIHPQDLASILDQEGVCIRTGHHCTQPLLKYFNLTSTARASLSFYNNQEDIDQLIFAIHKAKKLLG